MRRRRRHKDEQLREADAFRRSRRAVDQDITAFGEELVELHTETAGVELDPSAREDYQRALDRYEQAKRHLQEAQTASHLTVVATTVSDGRFAQACVLASRDGEAPPDRRPPCFFNPGHGMARTDVSWAPPGGTSRDIPVCLADARRLEGGQVPDVRLVRSGDRMVPWFAAGEALDSYAHAYFGPRVDEHRTAAARLAVLHAGPAGAGWGFQGIGLGGVGYLGIADVGGDGGDGGGGDG